MTPHFTTPCYCLIEDADKRKEICEQLERIGYFICRCALFKGNDHLHASFVERNTPKSSGYEIHGIPSVADELCYSIDIVRYENELENDCGTNTELFLALAGMRSDTDKGQWFVAQSNIMFKKLKGEVVTASKKRYISIGEMFMPLTHNLRFTWFGGNSKQLFRLATAAELIEHFNNK